MSYVSFQTLDMQVFSHSTRPWILKFKLVLIVHFLSVRVVSAVASGEHVGLSTVSLPEAAMMKIQYMSTKESNV